MTANQFSLRAALIATALVAVAAWFAKIGFAGPEPLCILAVFPLVGAAVGTLAGNVRLWIRHGVGVDIVLMGLALFL
jgi:hypothetical protein